MNFHFSQYYTVPLFLEMSPKCLGAITSLEEVGWVGLNQYNYRSFGCVRTYLGLPYINDNHNEVNTTISSWKSQMESLREKIAKKQPSFFLELQTSHKTKSILTSQIHSELISFHSSRNLPFPSLI